jgi:glycerol-3-phosphate acyltransferase PlsY
MAQPFTRLLSHDNVILYANTPALLFAGSEDVRSIRIQNLGAQNVFISFDSLTDAISATGYCIPTKGTLALAIPELDANNIYAVAETSNCDVRLLVGREG